MAPLASGRAKERAMGDVQPRKITGILGHFGESNVGVAPSAGGIR